MANVVGPREGSPGGALATSGTLPGTSPGGDAGGSGGSSAPRAPRNPSAIDRADFLFGLMLAGLALAWLIGALRMPWRSANWSPLAAPGLTPVFLSSVMLLLSTGIVIRATRRQGWRLRPAEGWRAALAAWHMDRLLLALFLCLAYVLALGRVPYGPATAAFVALFAWVFRGGAWWKVLLAGVLTAAGVVAVFGRIFLVPLP